MPNIIAHRGNLNGPNSETENTLNQLNLALSKGYDVEVDVWNFGNKYYVGHELKTNEKKDKILNEEVNVEFLQNTRVLVHCKNIDAFVKLSKYPTVNCFVQENDGLSYTSQENIVYHSVLSQYGNVADKRSIIVNLECKGFDKQLNSFEFGVCTDYAEMFPPNYNTMNVPRVLVIDIDGVMTNGTKTYAPDGTVVAKQYCDRDFTAIKRFKSAGIEVCFLSGDKTVNENMAAIRDIDFIYSRKEDGSIHKADFLEEICQKYQTIPNFIAYVGDDYYDVDMLVNVGFAFCPLNSPNIVKRSSNVLPVISGDGVIAALYDHFEPMLKESYPTDNWNNNNEEKI